MKTRVHGKEKPYKHIIWALTRENLSSGVCEQHRRRPACASAQSYQCLCYSFFWKVSYVNLIQVKFQFSS